MLRQLHFFSSFFSTSQALCKLVKLTRTKFWQEYAIRALRLIKKKLFVDSICNTSIIFHICLHYKKFMAFALLINLVMKLIWICRQKMRTLRYIGKYLRRLYFRYCHDFCWTLKSIPRKNIQYLFNLSIQMKNDNDERVN